ncbi:MAG: glycoside hydrolase family 31 protein [Paracoccaceae bacterium]
MIAATPTGLTARMGRERLAIDAIGRDAIRVRATPNAALDPTLPSGLLPDLEATPQVEIGEGTATLTHGRCRLTLTTQADGLRPRLHLAFHDTQTGAELLREEAPHILYPDARHWLPEAGALHRFEQRFASHDGERFWGLGQHQHGRLDQKGCVIGLRQMNTEVSIPFAVSSRGYGFLWNMPATGQVELAANHTRWIAEGTPQADWVVIAGGTPEGTLRRYMELTGTPPPIPDWASGFWQCKLRYSTQAEVLEVAREHLARGHPLSCLVIDFFNWTRGGEWRFDPAAFPDPAAMVAELREMGIELMVSIWPTVNENAATFPAMRDAGHLIETRRGVGAQMNFVDAGSTDFVPLHYYDATNPEARAYHWDRVREGYGAHGFRSYWLDANEPEVYPAHPDNMRLHLGEYRAVGGAYPALHQSAYADAPEGGLLLSRSAWIGSQRMPVVVWSGDVKSSFADLSRQIRAGLNMAMSGIGWWTTDIGGFKGGDMRDPAFHQLLIRWFQFAAFCPIFRLHGFRRDSQGDPALGRDFLAGGAANEVWSFGLDVEAAMHAILELREALRPYVHRLSDEASESGLPPMRPLLLAFPDDAQAVGVEDQYLFGPDLMVAPVLTADATSRPVYLPPGAAWTCAWTGRQVAPGWHQADTPMDRIPVYLRDGAVRPW